jgi:hypothetical protein
VKTEAGTWIRGLPVTTITLNQKDPIGEVDPRFYRELLEHVETAVYEGVYGPGSPHAYGDSLRTDVLASLLGRHHLPTITAGHQIDSQVNVEYVFFGKEKRDLDACRICYQISQSGLV